MLNDTIMYFRADERMILMIASFISAFAFFGMIPMTDDPPNVSDKTRNGLESWIPEQAAQNLTVEVVGCRDPPQTWCTKVGRIFLPQYIIAQILFAIGFSAANLTALTIFSKILGPFPQVCRVTVATLVRFSPSN